MLRRFTAATLLIAVGAFSFSFAIEVLHPVEEEPHVEHPQSTVTAITAPLPCDEACHAHQHHCLHSQQLTIATGFDADTASLLLDLIEDGEPIEFASRPIVRHLGRGPPFC